MRIQSNSVKVLKKIDDVSSAKYKKTMKGKLISKSQSKRHSKNALKMLPGQVH